MSTQTLVRSATVKTSADSSIDSPITMCFLIKVPSKGARNAYHAKRPSFPSVSATDGSALLVHAVPATLHGDAVRRRDSLDVGRLLLEQLDAVEAEERLTGPDRVAATLACRAAVRAGDVMAIEQQRALLEALERAETPQSCPHGRPTMLHLSRAALERAFGRR